MVDYLGFGGVRGIMIPMCYDERIRNNEAIEQSIMIPFKKT